MDIRHDLQINATAQTIYAAVSTQEGISGWWSKDCQIGESEGAGSVLNFNKQGKIVTMGFKTIVLSPNKRAVWECTENANPAWIGTQVITEITENEAGCQVAFAHANFDEKWKGQASFEMTKGGWEHFIKSLVSFCETGVGQPR